MAKKIESPRGGVSDAAIQLVNESIVWDMTLPWVSGYADDDTLRRFHDCGIDVISLTIGGVDSTFETVTDWKATVTRKIESQPDTMVLCKTIEEIDSARTQGKLALLFNFQETLPFGRKIDRVSLFYGLGVRHALLSYNAKNLVGDGCAERTDCGLSRWGIELIEEMNRVGMLVDGTHSGYRTTMEALEITDSPFIFSHSNAWSVFEHYRNIKDDQIKACASTGGVIGINGLGEFLDDHDATTQSMFKHIDYIANLVGPEYVGLGLDYVRDVDGFWDWVRYNDFMWPKNEKQERTNSRFAQPEQVLELVDLMLNSGYSESDAKAILGGNFRRVCEQVWK